MCSISIPHCAIKDLVKEIKKKSPNLQYIHMYRTSLQRDFYVLNIAYMYCNMYMYTYMYCTRTVKLTSHLSQLV